MRLALALLLASAPALACAQTTVGVRVSALYAAPVDPDPGISGRAGLGLVAFAERSVGSGVMLGADIGVLQGGFTQEVAPEQTTGAPGTLRARVTVLTMAPAVTASLGRGLELFAGPRFDFRMSESGSLDGQTGLLQEYNDAMLGLAAGAGLRMPAGSATARLDIRTSYLRVTSARSELQTELRVGLTL